MSPPASQDAIGLVIDHRYRLVAKIGTGPSATVYLADDVRLRRRVAVKMLAEALADEPGFVDRFGAEMQSASALRHPHIGMVFDWGVDRAPYVVGEYFEAGSLRRLLDRPFRMSPSQGLQFALAAARALAYAHERGVVHRDLNPSNVLFGDDERLRITDFGLARAHAEAASTRPMGAEATSVRYASPEQARGASVDGRADVYALALMVIEAVSGVVPFVADTALATLMGRVDRTPEIPDVLAAMAGPLARATTVDPDDRIDAADLVTALMAVAAGFDEPEPLPLVARPDRAEPGEANGGENPDDITLVVAPGTVVPIDVGAEPGGRRTEPTGPDLSTDTVEPPGDVDPAGGVGVPGPTGGDGSVPVGGPEPDDEPDSGPDDGQARRNHRRWRIAWAVFALVLVVGGGIVGFLVFQAQRTPTHLVPEVVGLEADSARTRLEALGFEVTDRRVRQDGTTAGEVIGVDPEAGTRLAEGERVTLTVSSGLPYVTIPADLAGVAEDTANERLTQLGFVLTAPTEEFSEDVEVGLVLGADPALGDRAEKGSAVSLVLSKGPRPRVVPDVSGMTPDQAEAALREIGLVPVTATRLHPEIDQGGLIGLDPAPGASVPRGATVTVVVSSGLSVTVPSLDGVTTVPEAIGVLQNAGLVANNLTGTGSLSGRPVAFDPPAGAVVAKGSPVDIVVE